MTVVPVAVNVLVTVGTLVIIGRGLVFEKAKKRGDLLGYDTRNKSESKSGEIFEAHIQSIDPEVEEEVPASRN